MMSYDPRGATYVFNFVEKIGKSTQVSNRHCSTLALDWFAYSTVHGFAIKLDLFRNLLNSLGDIKHLDALVLINMDTGFP